MNRKKNWWINTNSILAYLFSKVVLALFLLLVAQTFFYLNNTRIFHVDGWAEWRPIIWGNIVFGAATVGIMLIPYFFANIIPFRFRWNKVYHGAVEVLFYCIPVLFILIANTCDAAYYQYTYRRLSGEIFSYLGISGDMGSLWSHFVIDYWQATVFAIVVVVLFFWLNSKIHLAERIKYRKFIVANTLTLLIGAACIFFIINNNFLKEKRWHDPAMFSQHKNSAMVTNSTYSIISTLKGGTLHEQDFMDAKQATALFNPAFSPDEAMINWEGENGIGWQPNDGIFEVQDTLGHSHFSRKNVVVIVLESFSQEYMGCYNKNAKQSFTPFLDSLAQHSVVYQGRANGKKSIEGIPAIFSSVPTLMPFPLNMSDYAGNNYHALPAILHENGYHTAFFHGSHNGVMSFDKMCERFGFQEYYGKNEYMADRYSKKSDYDGCWGIYDEFFLQYMVRKLSTFEQPFMAGVFTLSSHHPYTMQPEHEGDFIEGPHPLCRVVMYSDNALRKFFDEARKTKWYQNTIFVITADHSGQGLTPEYNDYNGWYRIPMMFYLPYYEEVMVPEYGLTWSTHKVYPRLMQQTDIMPTLLDYLGIQTHTVCFGTSAFRNPTDGWQIAYGNGFYQLETKDGVALLSPEKEEGNTNKLKAIVQQYNNRLINNHL